MFSSKCGLYPVASCLNLESAVLGEVFQIIILFLQSFVGTVFELKPATTASINVLSKLVIHDLSFDNIIDYTVDKA